MLNRLKLWAQNLKSELVALWLAERHAKPKSYAGLALIVAIWIALAWLAWLWLEPHIA